MKKEILGRKIGLTLGICAVLFLFCSNAFARDSGGHRNFRGDHRQQRHHDGRFFGSGGLSFEFFFGVPRMGGVIKVLPPHHRIIVVRGVRYYYYNDIYYTDCPLGYVVVPQPVLEAQVVVPVEVASGEVVTIYIPQAKGGYAAVTLTRYNGGYIGPQGEYYLGHPSVQQLTALYGR